MSDRRVVLDVQVMGIFAVVIDGRPIGHRAWGRIASERLFKLLIAAPGHRLRREAAAETLWPEMDPHHQEVNLRKALHFARRAIGPGRPIMCDGPVLRFADHVVVRLDLDRWLAEVDRVARRKASVPLDPQSDPQLDELLRLGQAGVLPDDQYEDRLARLRERVSVRWRELALEVAESLMQGGRHPLARTVLDAILANDPADEDAHRLSIMSLNAEGRHHAARRQFLTCRRELAEAFGSDPSPETVEALGGVPPSP